MPIAAVSAAIVCIGLAGPGAPPAGFARTFEDYVRILQPTLPSQGEPTRIFVYSSNMLDALSAESAKSRWPRPLKLRAEPEYLGQQGPLALFATRHRVLAIDDRTGGTEWSFGTEQPFDPLTDPETDRNVVRAQLSPAGALYVAVDRRRLVCLDARTGRARWNEIADLTPDLILASNKRFVAYLARRDSTRFVVVADAATGRTLATHHATFIEADVSLVMRADDSLVVWSGSFIECLDLPDGAKRWSADLADLASRHSVLASSQAVFCSLNDGCIRRIALHDGSISHLAAADSEMQRPFEWLRLGDGVLAAASPEALVAFDAAAGREIWNRSLAGLLDVQPPILTPRGIFAVTRATPATRSAHDSAAALCIHRFDLKTGRELPVIDASQLVTEPLAEFRGLFITRRSLILLDGRRLIGYLRPSEKTDD